MEKKLKIRLTNHSFKKKGLAVAIVLCCSTPVLSAPIALTGDYIRIGTNDFGTLGSGGGSSPGVLYDSTGTSTFNTAYDYLTPGSPFEGFTITATSGGTTYSQNNNNAGAYNISGTLNDVSSGDYRGVSWSGSWITGGATLLDIVNTVGFNTSDTKVTLTTTITAREDLTDLYFARYIDPDAVAAPGDSSYTNNFQGADGVASTNLVYAEALVSKYVIGLYTAASNVNTGVSQDWERDPTFYYAGTNDGNGDYTIGLAYYVPTLNIDGSITFTYYYIFGTDIAQAVDSNVGGLSVLTSSTNVGNTPVYPGAYIIDATPELLALFSGAGLSGDDEVSGAASQTLPLLTGGGLFAARTALYGINGVVGKRQAANLGLSSGDVMLRDKHFWIKPFGTWTEQNNRHGVFGYDANTGGLVLGLDSAISDSTRLGLAFAYASTNVDGHYNVAPHSLDIDTYQLIGYGSHSLDAKTDLTFQADFGQNKNQGKRVIAFTSNAAESDYESYSAHVGAGIVRSYALNESNRATASLKADYTWVKDESYNETGAGLLNLDVKSNTTEALVAGIEGQLIHTLNPTTNLSAKLGVGYDLINDQASITSAFAGAPGAEFTTRGIDPNPWIGSFGLGLLHAAENGVEISVNYDAEHRSDFLNQTASLKFRMPF